VELLLQLKKALHARKPATPPFGRGIAIGNTEMLHAAVCEPPQRMLSDTDITDLLRFRNKTILARKEASLKMSVLQFSAHYTSDGRGGVLNVVGAPERPSLTSWTQITYQ
jgi:hypothetical protein